MQISKSKIIFVSYATLRKKLHFDPGVFISARSKPLSTLSAEILSHYPPPPSFPTATSTSEFVLKCFLILLLILLETLLIIDTLQPLSSTQLSQLSPFLSSLLIYPTISLLSTLHTDIPTPYSSNPYTPSALTTLTYLATAILTVSNFSHVLERKKARDRSLQEPVFGLKEKREGVLVGLKGKDENGVVVRMEIRRRSGRGVVEDFVLLPPSATSTASKPTSGFSTITLLDEHPLYSSVPVMAGNVQEDDEEVQTTFSLGLTEKQKRDREGVVLPYFDAQKEGGGMEGGRILYDMGVEDREDFDDEEDEI